MLSFRPVFQNAYREKLEQEKEKYKEVWKEKEDEIMKLQETKKILSWEINRSRDEMEKEIERQIAGISLFMSLVTHFIGSASTGSAM